LQPTLSKNSNKDTAGKEEGKPRTNIWNNLANAVNFMFGAEQTATLAQSFEVTKLISEKGEPFFAIRGAHVHVSFGKISCYRRWSPQKVGVYLMRIQEN
jgi:hypothetical protein